MLHQLKGDKEVCLPAPSHDRPNHEQWEWNLINRLQPWACLRFQKYVMHCTWALNVFHMRESCVLLRLCCLYPKTSAVSSKNGALAPVDFPSEKRFLNMWFVLRHLSVHCSFSFPRKIVTVLSKSYWISVNQLPVENHFLYMTVVSVLETCTTKHQPTEQRLELTEQSCSGFDNSDGPFGSNVLGFLFGGLSLSLHYNECIFSRINSSIIVTRAEVNQICLLTL